MLLPLHELEAQIPAGQALGREVAVTADFIHISYCYMKLGQWKKGRELIERAYLLLQNMDIMTLHIMARRCLACYRPAPESRILLEEALEIARTHHCRLEEAACLLSLAPLASDESEKMDFWQAGKKILEEIEATAWLKGHSPDNPPFIPLMW